VKELEKDSASTHDLFDASAIDVGNGLCERVTLVGTIRRHHPITPYAFLTPAVVILALFFVWSLVDVAISSTTNATAFRPAQFVGLSNYARLLSDDRFWTCLGNSALYLLVTPAIIVVSLLSAMVIDAKLRGFGWLRVALFLPVITPTIVAALAFRVLYNEDTGLLNAILHQLGSGGARWLSERPWTLVSAAIVTLWKGFGFYMMIFLAGLMSVPRELKEAAALDGAGRWQVFRTVTWPALLPSISLVFVVSSISALKVFDELYVTIQGAPLAHKTIVPLIYSIAFEDGDFGMACAVGVTLFAIILVFSIINLRLTSSRAGSAGGGS